MSELGILENSPSGGDSHLEKSHELVSLAMQTHKRGVLARLIAARTEFQTIPIKKSGHNKFAGYTYFELGDFLPAIQHSFHKWGLVDVISFTETTATMTVYDVIDGSYVTFTSPMGSASLKGCHEVQNIGAVETYQRRYLYTVSMAVVESDALDATTGGVAPEQKPVKAEPKAKPDTGEAKVIPTQPSANKVLFVDSLIELGSSFTSLSELTSLWKANQGQIDDLKITEKAEFKRLQEGFAILKNKFKDEN